MYTKCITYFNKLLYTFCTQHQKNYTSKILYTKCIQKFVDMWYTFGIQKFVKIWDTFCIQYKFVKMRNSFCIHFVYISSDLLKAYNINMYTICIQNPYKMHIQIIVCRMDPLFQHILTHLLCISKKKPPNLCSWLATQTLCGLNGLSDCMNLLTTFRRV